MASRGAPKGNQNGKKARIWSEAIEKALASKDGVKISRLANVLVDKAMEGDLAALKEIGDRLEGKAAQQQIISGDPENPLTHQITEITRKIIK